MRQTLNISGILQTGLLSFRWWTHREPDRGPRALGHGREYYVLGRESWKAPKARETDGGKGFLMASVRAINPTTAKGFGEVVAAPFQGLAMRR